MREGFFVFCLQIVDHLAKNQASCRETPSRICPSGIEGCRAGAKLTEEFRNGEPISKDGTLTRVQALSNFVICQNQAENWAMTLSNAIYSSKNDTSFPKLASNVDPKNKNLNISGTRFIALIGPSASQVAGDRFDAYVKENGHLIGDLKGHLVDGKNTKSYCEGAYDIAEAVYARSLRLLNRCSELSSRLLAELNPDELAFTKKLFANSRLDEHGFTIPKKPSTVGNLGSSSSSSLPAKDHN